MTEAVFDFADIKRRMDRKPETMATLTHPISEPDDMADAFAYLFSVTSLRAHLDATESNQIEDDGWITLWAY